PVAAASARLEGMSDTGAQDALVPAPGLEAAGNPAKLPTHRNDAGDPSQGRQQNWLQFTRGCEHFGFRESLLRLSTQLFVVRADRRPFTGSDFALSARRHWSKRIPAGSYSFCLAHN